ADVHRRGRLAVRAGGLLVDAVSRLEPHQIELLGRGGAHHPVEVIEHLRHQIPGRSGVEDEALLLPRARTTAEFAASLEQSDAVPVTGQEAGRGETAHSAADDDDSGSTHRFAFMVRARTRMRALTAS